MRRLQGNHGAPSDLPSRLRTMVWDTDRVVTGEASVGEGAMA